MGGSLSKTPLERATSFAQSQKWASLVVYAASKGVHLEIHGLTTILKHANLTSVGISETTWKWEDDDAENFIFNALLLRIQQYENSPRDDSGRILMDSDEVV